MVSRQQILTLTPVLYTLLHPMNAKPWTKIKTTKSEDGTGKVAVTSSDKD